MEHIEVTEKINLEQMLNIISRWRVGGATAALEPSKPVANILGDRNSDKKKDSRNKPNSGKFVETRNCLVCDRKGHLVGQRLS